MISFIFSLRFLAGLVVGGLLIYYFKDPIRAQLVSFRTWFLARIGFPPKP